MKIFFLSTLFSAAMSLFAQFAADERLSKRVAIVGDFIGLQYSENRGIAFGLQLPPGVQEFLILTALVFVCYLAIKTAKTLVHGVGFGLIVGGAIANIIDRLPDGRVTDFFQIGSFPIFNVADTCITVGVLFLLADSAKLFHRNKS